MKCQRVLKGSKPISDNGKQKKTNKKRKYWLHLFIMFFFLWPSRKCSLLLHSDMTRQKKQKQKTATKLV